MKLRFGHSRLKQGESPQSNGEICFSIQKKIFFMQLRPRFISRLPSAAAILQEIRASVWTGGCILAGGGGGITDPLPSRVAKGAILLFSPASMPQICPSISTREKKEKKNLLWVGKDWPRPPPRLTCTREGRFQIRISCYFSFFFSKCG